MAMTLRQALDLGLQHHQAGRLAEAQSIYQQILSQKPNSADAIHLLGVIEHQGGRWTSALQLFQQAITLNPNQPAYLGSLGLSFAAQGRLDEAIAAYRKSLLLDPTIPQTHCNFGLALRAAGKSPEAAQAFARVIELQPDDVDSLLNLANLQCELGRFDQAIAGYRNAISIRPQMPEAHYNLGIALHACGQTEESEIAFRHAIALRPGYADALLNLGNVVKELGNSEQAMAICREALALRPNWPEALHNLAISQHAAGKLDEAADTTRQVLTLRPNSADAHIHLGNILRDTGEMDPALAAYRRGVELGCAPRLESNLLFATNFHPAYDRARIADEHRRWNQIHAQPLMATWTPHENDRSPDRKLRIGYVSPDLRDHPVGRFMLPLLSNHDRTTFEVICYADVRKPDTTSKKLQAHADRWRPTSNLTDERLADAIREDKIDILVDLTMHTDGNRLLVFARKPAPVQVSYLAYAGTTGLAAMDYRLTDPYLDPPDRNDDVYCERPIRLPESYWCYQPLPDTPDVTLPPALAAGRVTFGCFNNYSKISAPLLETWAKLLHRAPHADLMLYARPGAQQVRVRRIFSAAGIDTDRLRFTGLVSVSQYFHQYQNIDIALDPFPYTGGTTTCDALWMGVPVITHFGKTGVSRSGLSILSNVGLQEFAADTTEKYVDLAANLSNDLPRLSELRATLRCRMQQSPLMDAPRFTKAVEAAYRQMWKSWCYNTGGNNNRLAPATKGVTPISNAPASGREPT